MWFVLRQIIATTIPREAGPAPRDARKTRTCICGYQAFDSTHRDERRTAGEQEVPARSEAAIGIHVSRSYSDLSVGLAQPYRTGGRQELPHFVVLF